MGLGAVTEEFAEQNQSVIDRLRHAVRVVFRELDAGDGMVRIGGPVIFVLVPDIVRVIRVVMDEVLEVGALSLRVGQPLRGPFRLCHIRIGVGV